MRFNRTYILIGLLCAVAFASLIMAAVFPRERIFKDLESALVWTRGVYLTHPVSVQVGIGCIYAALAAISFPGMITATILVGAVFGTASAVAVTALAGAGGCLANFIATRYYFREAARTRWRTALDRFDAELAARPTTHLLLLRLLPIAPYYLVNCAAALSQRIGATQFFLTTLIGTLPKNYIFASAGAALTLTGNIEESLTFPLVALTAASFLVITYGYVSRHRARIVPIPEK